MAHVHGGPSPSRNAGAGGAKKLTKSQEHLTVDEASQLGCSTKADLSHSMHSVKSAAAQLSPPDGGFGWVVVLGSFLIHVVADGVTYAYGALVPILEEEFKGGTAATAAVGSTLFGITLSSGPIASALVNRYGCRPITIAGAFIATAGTLLTLLSPNITFMIISFGVVGGFGLGLIYLPAIVSVTQWFEKKRAFATGIAVCGSGVGTFLFSPISSMLAETYSWDGAFLIIAGILFNCAVFGALFRPVEYESVPVLTTIQNDGGGSDGQAVVEVSLRRPKISVNSMDDKYGTGADDKRSLSMMSAAKSDTHIHVSRNKAGRMSPDTEPTSFARSTSSSEHIGQGRSRSRLRLETIGIEGEVTDVKEVEVPPFARKDCLYTGSITNLPEYQRDPERFKESMLDINKTVVVDASGHHTTMEEMNKSAESKSVWQKIKDGILETMDPALLKDWVFIYFIVSNFLTSLAFQVPYVFVVDRAQLELGLPSRESALLLSMVGVGNVIGRLGFGFLSDRPKVNRLWLYNIAVTVAGVAMCLILFCRDYPTLIAFSLTFGLFIGAFVTLTSVLLVDLFGLDKLTNAFGILLFFQGAATFAGPPIGGAIKDSTGTYDMTFFIFGILMAISGSMLFFIPCIRNMEIRFKARRRIADDSARYTVSKANGLSAQNGDVPPEQITLLNQNENQSPTKSLPVQSDVPVITINDRRSSAAISGDIPV